MVAEDHSKLLLNSAQVFLSLHLGPTQFFVSVFPLHALRSFSLCLLFLKKVAKKKVQLGNILLEASWFS